MGGFGAQGNVTNHKFMALFGKKILISCIFFIKKVLNSDLCARLHANWVYGGEEARQGHSLGEACGLVGRQVNRQAIIMKHAVCGQYSGTGAQGAAPTA